MLFKGKQRFLGAAGTHNLTCKKESKHCLTCKLIYIQDDWHDLIVTINSRRKSQGKPQIAASLAIYLTGHCEECRDPCFDGERFCCSECTQRSYSKTESDSKQPESDSSYTYS